jgi:hypothetical protein
MGLLLRRGVKIQLALEVTNSRVALQLNEDVASGVSVKVTVKLVPQTPSESEKIPLSTPAINVYVKTVAKTPPLGSNELVVESNDPTKIGENCEDVVDTRALEARAEMVHVVVEETGNTAVVHAMDDVASGVCPVGMKRIVAYDSNSDPRRAEDRDMKTLMRSKHMGPNQQRRGAYQ